MNQLIPPQGYVVATMVAQAPVQSRTSACLQRRQCCSAHDMWTASAGMYSTMRHPASYTSILTPACRATLHQHMHLVGLQGPIPTASAKLAQQAPTATLNGNVTQPCSHAPDHLAVQTSCKDTLSTAFSARPGAVHPLIIHQALSGAACWTIGFRPHQIAIMMMIFHAAMHWHTPQCLLGHQAPSSAVGGGRKAAAGALYALPPVTSSRRLPQLLPCMALYWHPGLRLVPTGTPLTSKKMPPSCGITVLGHGLAISPAATTSPHQ